MRYAHQIAPIPGNPISDNYFEDVAYYDAFGNRRSDLFVNLPYEPIDSVGYKGQFGYYTDPELSYNVSDYDYTVRSPLMLLGMRFYDPSTGRFLNRDPIGYDGGINVYAYCQNDPINAVDPKGLSDAALFGMNAHEFYLLAGMTEIVGGGPVDPVADIIAGSFAGVGVVLQLQDWANRNSWQETERQWKLHHPTRPPNMSPPGAKRRGAFRKAKRDLGIPRGQQPDKVGPNIDRQGRVQPGKEYKFGNKTIRDDAGGHYYGPNDPQNRGPHFNTSKMDQSLKSVIHSGNHYDYN